MTSPYITSNSVHPFETVSIKRISQAHPRFWTRINMASVRAEIDRLKWQRELSPALSGKQKENWQTAQ